MTDFKDEVTVTIFSRLLLSAINTETKKQNCNTNQLFKLHNQNKTSCWTELKMKQKYLKNVDI